MFAALSQVAEARANEISECAQLSLPGDADENPNYSLLIIGTLVQSYGPESTLKMINFTVDEIRSFLQ